MNDSSFVPAPVCKCLQPYVYTENPRYTVSHEWSLCRDKVSRPRYKALYKGRTIGEIMPSFSRPVVINALLLLIEDGGVGEMADLPGKEANPDD